MELKKTVIEFPERTQFVTRFYYGVGYRGYLTITRRTDGQSGRYKKDGFITQIILEGIYPCLLE